MNDDTTGTRIATTRRARGWSQKQLAEATFTTQTCISYWEADKRAITVNDLLTIAAALDVTAADLIPGTPTASRPLALGLAWLADDLRDLLSRLEQHLNGPDTVTGWTVKPTRTCDTVPGRHWHLFLHLHSGTTLRVSGLHFNTEPEAIQWGSANLRLRHVITSD